MGNESNRRFIKTFLDEKVNWILSDTSAFEFIRSLRPEHKPSSSQNVGGGNLLSALGLLAVINLLAKLNYILENNPGFADDTERARLQDALKQVRKRAPYSEPSLKEAFSILESSGRLDRVIPRWGEINETRAFIGLIQDFPQDIGLDKNNAQELEYVWNLFRNGLTHLFSPQGKGSIVTIDMDPRLGIFPLSVRKEMFRQSTDKAFQKFGSTYAIFIPIMWRDLEEMHKWLSLKIDQKRDDQIDLVYVWLNKLTAGKGIP